MEAWRVPFLGVFLGAIHAALLLPLFAVWRCWGGHTDGWWLVLLLVAASFSPLFSNSYTDRFIRFLCSSCCEYLPVKVILEDEDALKPGRSHILAYEPHSSLPVGIPAVFAPASPLLPKAFRGSLHGLASSVCFAPPFVRHLWWWLGLQPVSRTLVNDLLAKNKSVLLCPGGVQECLYMDPSVETVYLKKRHGFVRIALQHGTPIVPVFAFGQSKTYSWWRSPGVHWISRNVGAVPLLIWGSRGSPVPHRSPVTIVVGKPLEVPKIEQPSHAQIEEHLQVFIRELEALYHRHNGLHGCEKKRLVVS